MASTSQLQNQIVFQALNQMEDMMNNSMREKCSNLERLIKSKSYEVSEMPDECRRDWLLCLLGNLKSINQFCINVGIQVPKCDFFIQRNSSYDRQIFNSSTQMTLYLSLAYKKFLNYDGRLKKLWMDFVDKIYKDMDTWTDDSPTEDDSEPEDDCMEDSQ